MSERKPMTDDELAEVERLRAEVERLRAETEALKNSAFEFGVVFSTKVNEMMAREEWLITHILDNVVKLCLPTKICI